MSLSAYTEYLQGLDLRHFDSREITRYAERPGNTLPPDHLWRHVRRPLWVLDHLRTYLASPVRLTSIYRSPEYNRRVGGAPNSYHMANLAIDFQADDHTPQECHEILKRWRRDGVYSGGLGLYPTFCHIDCRGTNVDWSY